MATRYERKVDVSEAVGTGESLSVAVTVVVPDGGAMDERPAAFFGFPGGGYNRHYYDLQLAGGYSQAEHHAARRQVVVACDHLGVGDSDVPATPLDFEAVGRANAAAARAISDALEGGLITGVPVPLGAMIGMGHSFGGFVLTIGQAQDPFFDAVAFLGWSGIETLSPLDPGVDLADLLSGNAGNGLDHPMRRMFHLADVPEEIVIADMTKHPETGASGAPWSSAGFPGGPALKADRGPLGLGVVAADAAAITVPVFVGAGETDVVADVRAEPRAYPSSAQVTTTVVPGMAHMHNFASSRLVLWDRLVAWGASVVALRS